jgi:23S rRNA (guanine745-N1)-methyltransferase
MRMILCTVRGCGAPLARDGGRLVCPQGHAFDVARSGYINLLQPQERRSKVPGDSEEAVAARRRVHERGVTRPMLKAIEGILAPSADDVIVDAGCGDGWLLGEMQWRYAFTGYGIDISTPAIELAARRYPGCTWLVGNADRFVPLADGSATKILSITARMNGQEFRRVLRDDGMLLVAVAAPDDLVELRGKGKERAAKTIETFAPQFTLTSQRRLTAVVEVDEDVVRDLRLSIYRPRGATDIRRVTLSLDVLVFVKVYP